MGASPTTSYAHVVGTTISTPSQHLRKLRDLGLLRYRSDGRIVYYALRDPGTAELNAQTIGVEAR